MRRRARIPTLRVGARSIVPILCVFPNFLTGTVAIVHVTAVIPVKRHRGEYRTHNTYRYRAQKRRQYKTPKQGPEGRHMQAESRETAYKRRSARPKYELGRERARTYTRSPCWPVGSSHVSAPPGGRACISAAVLCGPVTEFKIRWWG